MLAQMVLIVGASWFMAQIVPFFADFVSLLGATLTPLIAFIVPLLLYGLCISTNDAHLQQEPMPQPSVPGILKELLVYFFVAHFRGDAKGMAFLKRGACC